MVLGGCRSFLLLVTTVELDLVGNHNLVEVKVFLFFFVHRRNFRIFAQNTLSPFFFPPLSAKNAHFQLLLFANLDLNTFFASFIFVYTWSVYFWVSK